MEEKKEKVFLGIIGAIVGGLIASILWILIGQIGFVASIAGYAIVYGSIIGYERLAGRISKVGLVICIVVSVVAVFSADYISYVLRLYRELLRDNFEITLWQVFAVLPKAFGSDWDLLWSFVKSLLIGYGFAIWGSYSFIKKGWKAIDEGKETLVPPKVNKPADLSVGREYVNNAIPPEAFDED